MPKTFQDNSKTPKMHPFHVEILDQIKSNSGKATAHTFNDSYLGNSHPRYAIASPVLRKIAAEWMRHHKNVDASDLSKLITSLVMGESSTEKCMAGILLDYATETQRRFEIAIFDEWLHHLQGWAEVDTLCTGKYSLKEIPSNFRKWKPFLKKLSKSSVPEKRRASLVFFCSPISHWDDPDAAQTIFSIINQLKGEKEILITKAISWVLRSMIRHHRDAVRRFVTEQKETLPAIAVRETLHKLQAGKKG
jgi:3-methyladenine DNA glycosylase AlkD